MLLEAKIPVGSKKGKINPLQKLIKEHYEAR
jgi:hypothetical protein